MKSFFSLSKKVVALTFLVVNLLALSACNADNLTSPTQTIPELAANHLEVAPTPESTQLDEQLSDGEEPGFILFAPLRSTTTYLINYDKDVVHTWPSEYNPGNSVYLLENGNLLRTGSLRNKNFDAGGKGGIVQEIDWDGNVVWEFSLTRNDYLPHHDIEYLPNGNILMIAWEVKTEAESIAAGRDPDLLGDGELWPDMLTEINPATYQIVWEWHIWDHLVQDYDLSKPNYGNPSDQPERVDLNYTSQNTADWNHTNAVDYNPELDQILISVHNFNEIWAIDHSTTTAEAAGPAGDLLFRWGNPQAHGSGTPADQTLFLQHDAQWIEPGLPGEGNILIFNNGSKRSRPYSTVEEIIPPIKSDGSYALSTDVTPVWSYQAATTADFYSQNISGAQRLLNGNTLICDGPAGRFFEITPSGETVWEYINPFEEFSPPNQKPSGGKDVFRAVHYPADFDGLAELDLNEDLADREEHSGDTQENDGSPRLSYPIVDTDQRACYDATKETTCPSKGQSFYGQDAQYDGSQPSYSDNGDGTITDNVTGLMWQKDPGTKMTYREAESGAESFSLASYTDWRLPTIKELYSLIQFDGFDPGLASTESMIPFIDTEYFSFEYGNESAGERVIDSQWATSSLYTGTTMNADQTMFGVNFADGRIKGYPINSGGPRGEKTYFVIYVRGNTAYGDNEFFDNRNGTISDLATGLTWMQNDSGTGMNLEAALNYCESLDTGESSDWRLPNVKELQSIVDYSRSPEATNSAALDPIFNISAISNEAGQLDYPAFWSSTTHANIRGDSGAYLNFGRSMGYMNREWMDVHGAGAQRSDPKTGSASDYPTGRGPQGDAIRVDNYVRCVTGGLGDKDQSSSLDSPIFDPVAIVKKIVEIMEMN